MVEPREVFKFLKENLHSSPVATEIYWEIPSDLPYFQGHFPQQPVLPGVAIVDASVVAVETATGRQFNLRKVSSAKFTGLVEPKNHVKICLKELAKGNWEIQWFSNEAGVESKSLAKIQCILTEPET